MIENAERKIASEDVVADSVTDKKAHDFFSDLVTKLNVTEFLYNMKGLSDQEYQIWTAAINKDIEPMLMSGRSMSNMICMRKAFEEFMLALRSEKNVKLRKLAVDSARNKLFVWAEVEDDDQESLRSILYADSVANLKIEEMGCYVSATVVEKSDNVPVPSHYILVLDNESK